VIWCIQQPERARQEREAIEELAGVVDWLTLHEWRLDNALCLTLDADISVAGRVFPVSLRYPNHFPHIPALVLPRGTQERWSYHQYGGELCLEWGPDNWRPEITGSDMLQSAYRLLSGENPAPDQSGQVASRHKTTLGQDLRGDTLRFLVTRDVDALIRTLPEGALWQGSLCGTFRRSAIVMAVKSVQRSPDDIWTAPNYPADILWEDGFFKPLALIRWAADSSAPPIDSRTAFLAAVKAKHPELADDVSCVLLARGERLSAYSLWDHDDKCQIASIIPPEPSASRLDADHQALGERKVALIGCGSVGSKIAITLARSGVAKFLVVDDDLMLPDNNVRNGLDWRDVGYHKAAAVARQIRLVNPSAEVDVREHRLGGQTATGSIETVLERIGGCDLIIDATADPNVFNYLSAAATLNKKPMLWAQVFGGGIGGLIARHRPGLEPPPATVRAQIEHWCYQRGTPIEHTAIDYETRAAGSPLIADDADVSVIAAHAARLAIDTLVPRSPSVFPYPVYLIGMREGWIFSQPFQIWPIEVGPPPPETENPVDQTVLHEETQRLLELLKKKTNETTPATDSPPAPAS
jgi:sulfur-carrier protein adenylyltransferase/sulfurtransferase